MGRSSWAVLGLWLFACSTAPGGSDVGSEGQTDQWSDLRWPELLEDGPILADHHVADAGDDLLDFSGLNDFGSGELVEKCPDGAGCFGDPCQVAGDCWSGLCVTHMGNLVCSQYCQEECPTGWDCVLLDSSGPDKNFACFSRFSHLCLPCHDREDCSTGTIQNACLKYDSGLQFCGSSCGQEGVCPVGFQCRSIETTDAATLEQCVLSQAECPCSDLAVRMGYSTPCEESNAFGTCGGLRSCGADGLGDCTAQTPTQETCNGLDDDCDDAVDDGTCDDGDQCTQDSCVPETGCNHLPLSEVACDDGDQCTFGDMCQQGKCEGTALQCDDGNPCTDNQCDPLVGCVYPANNEPCSDADPCTQGDLCVDNQCVPGAWLDCADTNPCTTDSCNPDGGCLHENNANSCTDGNECTSGDRCVQGLCLPVGSTDCNDGNPCTTDACDPSTGCVFPNNTDACNDGDPCTENDHCSNGYCLPGNALDCDDDKPCTNDSCLEGVGCQHAYNTAGCNDGDPCTVTDVCAQGVCVGSGLLGCGDSNPCTDDFCVPLQGCDHTANEASCSDNNACTLDDYCQNSVCQSGPGTLQCWDGNQCTQDSCSPASGCVNEPLSNTQCTDGNACTSGDLCQSGSCVSGALLNCNDNKVCTDDSCDPQTGCVNANNTQECNDNNACTLGDVCADGLCTPGVQPLDCDDDKECTLDSCNTATGCLHDKLTGTQCSDGNACTLGDVCSNGACVTTSVDSCDDGNICTTDTCEPATGCVHTPLTGTECTDNNACTLGDSCQGGTCVAGTGSPNCDDSNACTQDSCVPATGCLSTKLSGTDCTDGNECTLEDHCSNGTCISTLARVCNDNKDCTDDSCEPATGCVFTNDNTNTCTDNDVCTLTDQCVSGACVGSNTQTCNDGKACTDDSCDPQSGCQNVPDNTNTCTDNNLCTVGDHCSSGECVSDSSLNCDDGDPCTLNTCVPATGCATSSAPDGTSCNDHSVCTTVDKCSGGHCLGSTPMNCSDGNDCTYDNCDAVAGCQNPKVPDFMTCSDHSLCTVGDHCVNGQCVKTSDLPCDDGNDCTQNLCNALTGCDFSTPTPTCCGNGILETPQEECDDGNRVSGDGCESDCTKPPCPWWDYVQLFCESSCSYGGGYGCDQTDADIFCKLKTCNCNAYATSFQIKQVVSGKGFACAGSGLYAGPQTGYCVSADVWYSTDLMGAGNFGSVVTNVVCGP